MADNKQPKLNDDFLTKHAQNVFAESKNLREEVIEDRWMKDDDLYNGRHSADKKKMSDVLKSQARLFIPKTYSHVQRMLVDIHDTFNDEADEIVNVEAWKDVPEENRQIVKTLLNYRLNGNPINFYQESYELCLDALKNKYGILKIYPKLDITRRKTTFSDSTFKEEDIITGFTPKMECVPYEDIFFDKNATWKDYWKYPIIHRMLKTKDYLKRRGYKGFEDLPEAGEVSESSAKSQRQETQGTAPTDEAETIDSHKNVYIFEVWTFLDLDGDGKVESCSYVMGGSEGEPTTPIRGLERNNLPYKFEGDDYVRSPFVVGQGLPESHVMAGKSIPEIVEGLQKETNSLRNQRREAVALSLRKPILARRGARLNIMSLINRKVGSVILGDEIGPDQIRELNISPPGADSILEQNRTDQDFFETTSIPPQLFGGGSAEETATGTTSKNINANKKISKIVKNINATAILPAMKYLLRLEQEYEADEFIEKVTGRILGWVFSADSIPAQEVIQGEFGLKVSTMQNKQSLMNKLLLIADRGNQANLTTSQLIKDGVMDPATVKFNDPMAVYDRLLKLLGENDIASLKVKAFPPTPGDQGGGGGFGSQPRLPASPEAAITNLSSEAEGLGGG